MHGRGRRQRDLRRDAGGVAQEHELVERERTGAPQRRGRIGRGEIDLVAAVVAKLEQRRAHLEALRAFHEAAPIGAAAELAVGHDRKPDLLLHVNGLAHAIVLDARELGLADLVAGMAPERLPQRRRPQQAADVVGAKRRAAVRADAHGSLLRACGSTCCL